MSEERQAYVDNRSIDDAVIIGRRGSPTGTIAVPSGQETVRWPKVSGAPPGYPGIASYTYKSMQRLNGPVLAWLDRGYICTYVSAIQL